MENHHAIKFGKPSISIRAIDKPWRTVHVITRNHSPIILGTMAKLRLDHVGSRGDDQI